MACVYVPKQELIKELQGLTGSFFRFVNSKLSCERGLGALSSDNGDIVTGDQERAILLNTYFTSMCTADNGTNPAFEV